MPGQLTGADRLRTVILGLGLSLAVTAALVSYLYSKPPSKPAVKDKSKDKESDKKQTEKEIAKPAAPSVQATAAVEPLKSDVEENPTPVMNPVVAKQATSLDKRAPVEAQSGQTDKLNSPSWNELVEDDEKQESLSSTLAKMEISNPKPVQKGEVPNSSGGRQRSGSNRRHDSGVVSPNGNDVGAAGGGGAAMVAKTETAAVQSERDGGLGTSVCEDETAAAAAAAHDKSASEATQQSQQQQQHNNSKHINGSDSGQGSEADDGIRLAYHFYIPHYLCGKFIGVRGSNINSLKLTTKCSVQLRQLDENGCFLSIQEQRNSKAAPEGAVQVCLIEGTRTNIDHCLELIRQRFPLDQHPEVTLEQINLPSSSDGVNCDLPGASASANGEKNSTASSGSQPLQLGLTQGALHDVFVSHIVSGGHIFLQQPNHPTHHSLERLEDLMSKAYTKFTSIPDIPREVIEPGLVCVARCYNSKWYRVQVVRYDAANDTADVKFVDHGGYYNFPVSDLKQIRSDYLALPFQALECYLGNVIPLDGREWSIESGEVLRQVVQGVIISGRMLGVNEEGVPIVHLYGWVGVDNSVSQHEQQPRLLNRELVDRSVALWTEHVIANGAAAAGN